jgi:predicted DNA-binding protein (UPF0251 family)
MSAPGYSCRRQLNIDHGAATELISFPVTLARVEPGRKQVLIVEDWAEIRRLRRSEGVSISEIARLMGCSRNTVKAALANDGPPQYVRVRSGSLVDAYEPRIRGCWLRFRGCRRR